VAVAVKEVSFLFKSQNIILVCFISTCCGWAFAGQKIDKTIDADVSGTLYIENTRGQLVIEGWDKPQIQLQGELDDATKKLHFKSKGHKAVIKVKLKDGHHHGHGSDLKVFIPHDTRLIFKGVNSDYKISDLSAKIKGKLINGDVLLYNVHAPISISSVSGKIKVKASSGVARIESVSGKVSFAGKFEQAQLKSMSGKIMANIDEIVELKVENVSGDIAITGELQNNAIVRLNSVSGNIHYVASGKFSGECQIASQFGGKIKNKLTEDKPWSEMLAQHKLQFVSGDGSGKLMMNTVSGSVTLEK
jgi:hypothetical protein